MHVDVTLVAGGHCLCDFVVDLKASLLEFPGEASHRSEDEVKPLSVETATFDHLPTLDHEDAVVVGICGAKRTDLEVQLITEDPDRLLTLGNTRSLLLAKFYSSLGVCVLSV